MQHARAHTHTNKKNTLQCLSFDSLVFFISGDIKGALCRFLGGLYKLEEKDLYWLNEMNKLSSFSSLNKQTNL